MSDDVDQIEWRPIAGFDGLYEVGSHGEVRSCRWPVPRLISWHLTSHGYLRTKIGSRYIMQHVLIWETANGRPKPSGHDVHHINGVKTDNRIENLELIPSAEHTRRHHAERRIERGLTDRNGVWWKRCPGCGVDKPCTEEHWYFSEYGWPTCGRCRPCFIRRMVRNKQLRRARQREAVS